MQFHLNGFTTLGGEGSRASGESGEIPATNASVLPAEVDVLIVGCGPAGLTLAAQMALFPTIKTCIAEQKSGPLKLGQADGIACRTMEMFNAFGFADRVLREAYWVNETTFWRPDDADTSKIARGGRVKDTEDGLSEFPHVILNQARVHDFYLDFMRHSPSCIVPHYGRRLISLTTALNGTSDSVTAEYPVLATFEVDGPKGKSIETVRARYAVGCDGARSTVRRSLGLALKGDAANQAWGVMDLLAITDFPDIRLKAVINSLKEGSIVLIPREGGYLVRIYVELDKLGGDERVADRNITVEQVIAAANRVMHPYKLDVKQVAWWSVYEIGQRLCDRFDDGQDGWSGIPRIFIAGDSCHTHSPKAGQGMNVSMQDAFNLGWKLVSVLQGLCSPNLLRSYSDERHAIAKELIEFDKEWAAMLSASVKNETAGTGVDPVDVQKYFVRHGHYTAGTSTNYAPSAIISEPTHQLLAKGFPIGKRFHSSPVIRVADAKPLQLGHVVEADCRWRIFAFAGEGDTCEPGSPIRRLCDFISRGEKAPARQYTPVGADVDAIIDVRAVFQVRHQDLDLRGMHALLLPEKGRLGLQDYEKVFTAKIEVGEDIYEARCIDRKKGCVVIVRPDQFVASIMPIDAFDEISLFFDGIFKKM